MARITMKYIGVPKTEYYFTCKFSCTRKKKQKNVIFGVRKGTLLVISIVVQYHWCHSLWWTKSVRMNAAISLLCRYRQNSHKNHIFFSFSTNVSRAIEYGDLFSKGKHPPSATKLNVNEECLNSNISTFKLRGLSTCLFFTIVWIWSVSTTLRDDNAWSN